MNDRFEKTIVFHCAPSLAGIKPSNLVSLKRQSFPELEKELSELSDKLNRRGLRFRPLCECSKRVLVLVYRKDLLMHHLNREDVKRLLKREGYPAGDGFEAVIAHLAFRMESCGGFPHEIGLFLGYPLADVLGFIEHRGKNCKLSGYWKVYSDVKEAQRLFDRYTKCRNSLCLKLSRGKTIAQIFNAA